jgi:hypothetical protein
MLTLLFSAAVRSGLLHFFIPSRLEQPALLDVGNKKVLHLKVI